MQIRIALARTKTEEEDDLIEAFIDVVLDAIEDELHYLPALDFRGKKKIMIYFFNLSKREADVILQILRPEKTGDPDSLITRISIMAAKDENPTDPVFIFSPPGYRTKEDEERAEEKKQHGLDIVRMVRLSRKVSRDALYQWYIEDNPDWDAPPLTTKAYLESVIYEDEDVMTERIASERMPKNRRRRKPRSPRKKAADLPLDEDTRL